MTTNAIELGQRAHEQLEKLRARATELELEAQDLAKAFEQDPSPKAFTASQVAVQVAANARRQAEAFETSEDFLRPIAAAERAKAIARLAELRELIPHQHRVDACAERVTRLFGEFIGALSAEVDELRKFLDARNAGANEYNRLEEAFGDGDRTRPLLLDEVLEEISDRVRREHGPATQFGADQCRQAAIRHNANPGSSPPYVDVNVRFPCVTTREGVR